MGTPQPVTTVTPGHNLLIPSAPRLGQYLSREFPRQRKEILPQASRPAEIGVTENTEGMGEEGKMRQGRRR